MIVAFAGIELEIDLIIYDKDGTLFSLIGTDVHPMILRVKLAAKKLGRDNEFAKTLLRQLGYDPDLKHLNSDAPLVATHPTTKLAFATLLYQEGYDFLTMLDLVDKVYEEVWGRIDWSQTLTVVNGVRDTLLHQKKQGLKIALATNDVTELSIRQLKQTGLLEFFDAVVGSDSVKAPKPDPSMIIEICKRLDVQPSKAVIVGDSTFDMVSGRNAGLKRVIGVVGEPKEMSTPKETLMQQTDIVLDSLTSISM